jgi:predicted dehydrogenase
VDVVILAAPPAYRPLHFAAAVAAQKHVFAEKPIAVDATGVRSFIAANQAAISQRLAVAVGFQRRHSGVYRATIEQLQNGAIGTIHFCRAYWNQNSTWIRPRSSSQRELEYQLRNWQHFNWLGGDHIVEQHVHNLDVINWLLDAHPEKAQGAGCRQMRGTEGEVNGHHVVEFSYRGGVKLLSMCRQMSNCWNAVGEFAHGSQGWADIGNGRIYDANNQLIWEEATRAAEANGIQALLTAVQAGECPNEGSSAAISTMTAIMGRQATYSGKEVTWQQSFNSSEALADVASFRSLADSPPAEKEAGLFLF